VNAFREIGIRSLAVRYKVHLKATIAQPRNGLTVNEAGSARYEHCLHFLKSGYD
jgi:hypothetical protein